MGIAHTMIAGMFALAAAAPGAFAADMYPAKPVKLIVPFAPGGPTDLIARVVADKLRTTLGQPVVVENRAGAGGSVGTEAIARAEPDGYTIGVATVSTLTVNPILLKSQRFDPLKDLAPITNMASMSSVLMINASLPAKDFREFVALAKAHPGKYTWGSAGTGTIGHLFIEAVNATLKTEIRHVPYRGMAPAMIDAAGGQIEVVGDQYSSAEGYIKGGKLRVLAVGAARRLDAIPEVPTWKELGYPELNDLAITWFGLVAPARTPQPVRDKLLQAVTDALKAPELIAKLKDLSADPVGNTPEAFAKQIRGTLERNQRTIKAANISVQ